MSVLTTPAEYFDSVRPARVAAVAGFGFTVEPHAVATRGRPRREGVGAVAVVGHGGRVGALATVLGHGCQERLELCVLDVEPEVDASRGHGVQVLDRDLAAIRASARPAAHPGVDVDPRPDQQGDRRSGPEVGWPLGAGGPGPAAGDHQDQENTDQGPHAATVGAVRARLTARNSIVTEPSPARDRLSRRTTATAGPR